MYSQVISVSLIRLNRGCAPSGTCQREEACPSCLLLPFSWNADMMAAAGAVILDDEVNLETKAWEADEPVRRNEPGWTHDHESLHQPWTAHPDILMMEKETSALLQTLLPYIFYLSPGIQSWQYTDQFSLMHTTPREDTCVSGEDWERSGSEEAPIHPYRGQPGQFPRPGLWVKLWTWLESPNILP